jgi:thioredoxin 1
MLKVTKFSATWCGPCKALAPIMNEVKNEHPDVTFEEVDIDQNRDFTTQSGVASVPTVIFYKNGREVHRFSGVKQKTLINYIINQHK